MTNLTEIEIRVLKEILKRGLIRKSELTEIIDEIDSTNASAVAQALSDRGFLQILSPIGESCYTLTKDGIKLLNR